MAEKNPELPVNPLDVWRDAFEAMNRAAMEGMQQAGVVRLPDPVYGGRDFDATRDYGQKAAYDWPALMYDPAKQLEYAERMGRAWMALWNGWMAQAMQPAEGIGDPRPYDIFLSHSKRDEDRIREVERDFEGNGYRVYVDWSDDPLLDRAQVDRETAAKLQDRMRQCKALIIALSNESAQSPWVQWELGFFDALRGRIFILPLDQEAQNAVARQEYYGLYKVLDPKDYRADFLRHYAEAVR
ncbi:MAG TPA: toll/interleukin-1 receptor domain-containing protein [Candidatus Cybelea sp.]|nr:toll/interleukin-1 receptor domain-containing protein [Candidatus Cybelea sp.]